MLEIPATWMRGGTSKCWVFRKQDLDIPGVSVDEILLRAYGSPDHRQVDGVGGATSTTSKAVIVAPSDRADADVDYTFAQVGIEENKVDWGSNCGNCSAVVAPFAAHAGWVSVGDPRTVVRVFNTNTGQVIQQEIDTPGGELTEEATSTIPGVPFPGARVRMGFLDPAGQTTGALFPTGNRRDELRDGDGAIEATMVDAGAPVVIVKGRDLGLEATLTPAQVDASPELLARLDAIRRRAAVAMGLVSTPDAAERAIPKIAVVHAPREERLNVQVLFLSMGRAHPALPITGSVALTLAAREPGTVVADVARPPTTDELDISTAAGVVTTFVGESEGLPVVGATRTYRRLVKGTVFVPSPSVNANGDES